jgi:hypothetical protein
MAFSAIEILEEFAEAAYFGDKRLDVSLDAVHYDRGELRRRYYRGVKSDPFRLNRHRKTARESQKRRYWASEALRKQQSARSLKRYREIKADPVRYAALIRSKRKTGTGQVRGEAHGRSKLNETSVREIRRLYASGVKQVVLSRQFGVSQFCISAIVRRTSWGHVE